MVRLADEACWARAGRATAARARRIRVDMIALAFYSISRHEPYPYLIGVADFRQTTSQGAASISPFKVRSYTLAPGVWSPTRRMLGRGPSGTLLLIYRDRVIWPRPADFLPVNRSRPLHTAISPGLVWCVSMLGVREKTRTHCSAPGFVRTSRSAHRRYWHGDICVRRPLCGPLHAPQPWIYGGGDHRARAGDRSQYGNFLRSQRSDPSAAAVSGAGPDGASGRILSRRRPQRRGLDPQVHGVAQPRSVRGHRAVRPGWAQPDAGQWRSADSTQDPPCL